MNYLVRFPKGHEGADDDPEFNNLWHLKDPTGDGERTTCGLSHVDGYELENKKVEKGGITCHHCLGIIKFHKSVKL